MPRYDLVREKINNKAKMNTNITNEGSMNVKKLYEDDKEVLNEKHIATGKDDTERKLVSLGVLRKILDDYTPDEAKQTSFITDIKMIDKEKFEVEVRYKVLIDEKTTPELKNHKIRETLVNDYELYNAIYILLKNTMSHLLDKEEVTDYDYDTLDKYFNEYLNKFGKINETIQIATQIIISVQSNNVLNEANKNIEAHLSYRLVISSTNGPLFKHGFVNTTLNVVVYKMSEVVTDNYRDSQFRWTRKSNNAASDEKWANNTKRGKSKPITNNDYVAGGCSFICTLYDENGRVIATSN